MTTYIGLNLIGIAQYFELLDIDIDRSNEINIVDDRLFATLDKVGEIEFGVRNLSGAMQDCTWSLQHENKIYCAPTALDLGLIASDQYYYIELWNAGKYDVALDEIFFSSVGGYTLVGPSAPRATRPESVSTWLLTILVDGPPMQETTITFALSDGSKYYVSFVGRRLETFAFPCDAVNGVKVKYQFETLIARSNRFKEQRRSLRSTPARIMTVDFSFFSKADKEKFLNKLYVYRKKIIAVPFYPEEFAIAADPQGAVTINLGAAQVANRFAFENSALLVIYDEENSDICELFEIDSVVGGVVTITSPVVNSYDPAHSYVAPAILVVCPLIAGTVLSPLVTEFSLEIEEYING